jgi:hypothetical protein
MPKNDSRSSGTINPFNRTGWTDFFVPGTGLSFTLLDQNKTPQTNINIEIFLDFNTVRPYLMISIHKFTICLLKQ